MARRIGTTKRMEDIRRSQERLKLRVEVINQKERIEEAKRRLSQMRSRLKGI